ncbi:hypothetical protein [Variovorax sp.]|jgi:hypothetical protein|uniref:hypothetical protein n=1 Tax=Variovorax sp. TaxID=1871043 RepID=UPI004037D87C
MPTSLPASDWPPEDDMAGMDWFRWHHGSVTDPKFQLVARRAGASLPDVLAVWAYVLEAASQAEERGVFGEIDAEALDCLFNFPATETRTADILKAMKARGLIDEFHVIAWHKRQPKREREDDGATERKRKQRAAESGVTTDVTTSHATSHQKTPRGEESREEETSSLRSEGASARIGEICKAMRAAGLADVSPSHPKLLALLAAGITAGELVDAAIEAVKRKKPFSYALSVAEGRRRDSAVEALPSTDKPPPDPDSQPAVEAEGERLGLGRWKQTEQWPIYLAKVRKAQAAERGPSGGLH